MITFLREKLLIRFALYGYHEMLSICLCASFPFGFEGGMWDLIVPDHCPAFYILYVSRRRIDYNIDTFIRYHVVCVEKALAC